MPSQPERMTESYLSGDYTSSLCASHTNRLFLLSMRTALGSLGILFSGVPNTQRFPAAPDGVAHSQHLTRRTSWLFCLACTLLFEIKMCDASWLCSAKTSSSGPFTFSLFGNAVFSFAFCLSSLPHLLSPSLPKVTTHFDGGLISFLPSFANPPPPLPKAICQLKRITNQLDSGDLPLSNSTGSYTPADSQIERVGCIFHIKTSGS